MTLGILNTKKFSNNVLENIVTFGHNLSEDLYGFAAGEGTLFNITYSFVDEISFDVVKKSKRLLIDNDINRFNWSNNLNSYDYDSYPIPENSIEHFLISTYNFLLEQYIHFIGLNDIIDPTLFYDPLNDDISTVPDNNLNNSDTYNIKQFSYLSILIMLTSIMTLHIIF